jgi:outer membrane protein assembly factor BamB
MGRLAALKAASGKEVWSVDLRKEFGARYGTWAMSENVRIEGKALLCVPGGTKGAVVALDKTTGKRIWVNTEIEDSAAYCTPLIATHNGVRQLITLMQKSIVSVDVKTGKLLWKHEHETKHNQNVTKPIYRDGFVFTSSGHGTGGRWFKINPRSDGVTQVWLNKDLDNCHGGVILLDGSFYGSGCRLFRKGLVCVDLLTGKTTWNDKDLGNVSMTCADGMLYCLDRKGKVSLVEAKAKRCKIVSQFNLPMNSKKLCLAHPVVCGKRLYLRHWNELFAYDISDSGSK